VGLALGLAGISGWPAPEEMVRRYAVPLALISIGFVWHGVADRFSQRLSPLLFGGYLSHPLILRMYQAAHLPLLPTALFAALVFAVSAALVLVLQRTPLRILV
jgi:surface polysaccharide O-acyltransferase-like enzyme